MAQRVTSIGTRLVLRVYVVMRVSSVVGANGRAARAGGDTGAIAPKKEGAPAAHDGPGA